MVRKKKICLIDKLSGEKMFVKVSSINKLKKGRVMYPQIKEVIFGKIDGKGEEYAFMVPKRFKRC